MTDIEGGLLFYRRERWGAAVSVGPESRPVVYIQILRSGSVLSVTSCGKQRWS